MIVWITELGWGGAIFRRLAIAAGCVTRPDELTTIKYFTSRVTHEDPYHDRPHERERQQGWLAAIQSIPGLACVWGRHNQPPGERRKEKQTDVNIAVELLLDAIHPSGYQQAMLLSGDTDLAPAVWAVNNRLRDINELDPPVRSRRVTVLLPPMQSGKGWKRYFEERRDAIEPIMVTEEMLARSLLGYEIRVGGQRVTCPPEWRLPTAYLDISVPTELRPDR